MREVLKVIAYLAAYVVARMARLRGVAVVNYHSIESSDWRFGVSATAFEKQLRFLKRHRTVVPLEEIVLYAMGRLELPHGSVAITFDDGYKDTCTTVLPLLQKYDLPATLFLTTDLAPQKDLGDLARPTWADVQEMRASGSFSFQVHGETHAHLPDIIEDTEEFESELLACRDAITAQIGCRPRFVAYPYGATNEGVAEKTRSLGFEAAFTTEEGLVRKGDPLFALRRIGIERSTSFLLFMLRTTAAVEPYRSMKERLLRPKERNQPGRNGRHTDPVFRTRSEEGSG